MLNGTLPVPRSSRLSSDASSDHQSQASETCIWFRLVSRNNAHGPRNAPNSHAPNTRTMPPGRSLRFTALALSTLEVSQRRIPTRMSGRQTKGTHSVDP